MDHSSHAHAHHHPLPGDRTATDPVCGMSVDVETAKHVSEHEGETFYFCSAKCREKFDTRPEVFLDPALKAAPPEKKDEIYTCPMHPEIEQVGPGSCPIARSARSTMIRKAISTSPTSSSPKAARSSARNSGRPRWCAAPA